jgi:DNA-binding response OmpR family regulator
MVPAMAGQRVLLVENDLGVARAALRQLRHCGFEPFWASDCGSARQLVAQTQQAQGNPNPGQPNPAQASAGQASAPVFDAGIFDIDLDDGDGVSLANELSQLNSVNHIVFHTGSTAQHHLAAAWQLGSVYSKPNHFPRLVEDLEQHLMVASSRNPQPHPQSGFPPVDAACLQKAG